MRNPVPRVFVVASEAVITVSPVMNQEVLIRFELISGFQSLTVWTGMGPPE
jgi:hypothetical protein